MRRLNLISLFILLATCIYAQQSNYVFPEDAGVLDVTKAPYLADSSGNTDATTAIQTALDQYPNGSRTIYLPNGTYLISNTLKWPEGSGGNTYKRTMIQGQSKEGTIIKLKDNCEGYQDPSSRKAMIYTGPAPAQRFRNAIRGITVNTGTGNPGACGIQFNCSNEGTMQHVNIISGDGQGVYGLDLAFTNEIGPGYIYDLTVEGFDVGIMHGFTINSMIFEKITLRNQNECGFRNFANVSPIRGFVSENSVLAVDNKNNSATMVLMDATITGTDVDTVAIYNAGALYARNVTQSGYSKTIMSVSGLAIDVDETAIQEYSSHGVYKQFTSPVASLNLPVKDWPDEPWSDLSEWTNIMAYGAVGDGNADDTQALQDAIDSGKETVYLPGGKSFKISDTVRVRGAVKRVIGCESRLTGTGTILIEDVISDVFTFERIHGLYANVTIVNNSSKTFVYNSSTGIPIRSEGNGDMFLINIVNHGLVLNNPDQDVWVRQINTEEGDYVNITNNGADLWILGHKTERGNTKIHTLNGGRTELLGAHNYSTNLEKTDPWFLVEDASFSVAGVRETNYNGHPYTEYITEIRNGVTKTIDRTYFPSAGTGGGIIPLYTGFENRGNTPDSPVNITIDETEKGLYKFDWDDNTEADFNRYAIYMSSLQGGPFTVIDQHIENSEYFFSSQEYGTFYFIVTAINNNLDESFFGNPVQLEVGEPGAPEEPYNLKGIGTPDSITITWSHNDNFYLDYYEVYKRNKGGSFFILQPLKVKEKSWTDYKVTAGSTYDYSVRAVNIFSNQSDYSDTITLSAILTGNYTPFTNDDLLIYPNPVKDYIQIQIETEGVYQINLWSVNSQLLKTEKMNTGFYKFDISSVAEGTYFLEIIGDKKREVRSVIVE